MPRLISDVWTPDAKLQQHRLVRDFTEEELREVVQAFRAFCAKHELERVYWGQTFLHWLQNKDDPTWVPKRRTDIWVR